MDEFENTGELRKVFSGEIDLSSEKEKSTLMVDEKDILRMADAIRQNRIEDQIFAINLDRFLDNGARSSEYIYVCKTSNALAISGADKELDVVIAPRTIAKCMADPEIRYHGHGLTRDILQRIPEELRNPVMIFKGNKDSSLVVITRLKDNKSRGVMVAISLNEMGKRNEVNRISSVYGKDNINNYIRNQMEYGNLIAVNKKEAKIMLQSAGLQLPLEETYLNFNDSIAYTIQNVKGFEEKINEGRKNVMEYTNGLAKGEFLQHMYNKFPSAYEDPHSRTLLENIIDYCTEDNFTHTKNELFYTLVKLIPDVEEKELLNYMDENSMTKETIESILEQNVSEGMEYEIAKNAKTQVYFLQANSSNLNNAVVLRQDDVALIMEATPDGRFNGTVYDETVDLHQTDENGHIDTSRIKSELSENIGDGSGMYRFDQLVKESLKDKSSQLTAYAWWKVNHPAIRGYELVYVTNYDDVKLDEETRTEVILDKHIKRSVDLTSDFEHNMDSSKDYNKEFNDRFFAFPEDLEQLKMWISNQFNLNDTEMNNIVNSDEGKRLIILWENISYYANASKFDEKTIRREAYTYDPADPFTTATWYSPEEMRDDADYRNLIDQNIKAANKVVKNAKEFVHAYNFEEKFQALALKLSGEEDEQGLVEDNNCHRGR